MDQHADHRGRLIADGTPLTSQQDYLQRLADIEAAVARAQPDPDLVVERAAGLIAGRAGCRIEEAHAQLRLLATKQGREPAEVAADILAILHTSLSAETSDVRTAVEDALRPPPRPAEPASPHPAPVDVDPGWAETMRQIIAAVAGNHTVVAPVRDAEGQTVDFVFVAVDATVLDLSGRREDQVVGERVSELYPDHRRGAGLAGVEGRARRRPAAGGRSDPVRAGHWRSAGRFRQHRGPHAPGRAWTVQQLGATRRRGPAR